VSRAISRRLKCDRYSAKNTKYNGQSKSIDQSLDRSIYQSVNQSVRLFQARSPITQKKQKNITKMPYGR